MNKVLCFCSSQVSLLRMVTGLQAPSPPTVRSQSLNNPIHQLFIKILQLLLLFLFYFPLLFLRFPLSSFPSDPIPLVAPRLSPLFTAETPKLESTNFWPVSLISSTFTPQQAAASDWPSERRALTNIHSL